MELKGNITFNDLIEYSVFPNSFIRNGKLTPNQKVLFEILCSYDFIQSDGTRKGWCCPSLDSVAEHMGVEKRAVQTQLCSLVEKGLVTIIYRNTTANRKTSIYILNILPGLSEEDRQKIARSRNTEIKHLISGLNTIKVKIKEGIKYISDEEFDLQYLITGTRSSDVLEDDGPPEVEVNATVEEDDTVISFKKKKDNNEFDKAKYNSSDPLERVKAGNYSNIDAEAIRKYFKYLYEATYNEIYTLGDKSKIREISLINTKIGIYGSDIFIDMLKYFVEKYEKNFYNPQYPRPEISQLSLTWIMNKLSAMYHKDTKLADKVSDYVDVDTSKLDGEEMIF